MERNPAPPPPPASETVALPEAEELEEVEESLPARAEVYWDEAGTDGEEAEEELEMTEGEDNVELGGNSGLYSAMTGDVVPLPAALCSVSSATVYRHYIHCMRIIAAYASGAIYGTKEFKERVPADC